ncbi:hypothetical protein [Mesorhizobium sp. WSM3860]|uniref:hypothetical protein n=1 Tax=Mesorhizobium sp. WSM3860 TaxID=2029403 RepID=UPI001140D053|nr:hypothetical protein [Mesorhizobium sp. WSM3860]
MIATRPNNSAYDQRTTQRFNAALDDILVGTAAELVIVLTDGMRFVAAILTWSELSAPNTWLLLPRPPVAWYSDRILGLVTPSYSSSVDQKNRLLQLRTFTFWMHSRAMRGTERLTPVGY